MNNNPYGRTLRDLYDYPVQPRITYQEVQVVTPKRVPLLGEYISWEEHRKELRKAFEKAK